MPRTRRSRLIFANAAQAMDRSAAIRAERTRLLQLVEADGTGRFRNLDAEDLVAERRVQFHLRQGNLQVERPRPDARQPNTEGQSRLKVAVLGAPARIRAASQ